MKEQTVLALGFLNLVACTEDMRPKLRVHNIELLDKGGLPIVVGPHASTDIGQSYAVRAKVSNQHKSQSAWVHEVWVGVFETLESPQPRKELQHSWVSELRNISPGETAQLELRVGFSAKPCQVAKAKVLDASNSKWW